MRAAQRPLRTLRLVVRRAELRRSERFEPLPRVLRVARVAALVLVSLFAGGGAAFAVERIQESREIELLLQRNRLRVELAERRQWARELGEAARRRAVRRFSVARQLELTVSIWRRLTGVGAELPVEG